MTADELAVYLSRDGWAPEYTEEPTRDDQEFLRLAGRGRSAPGCGRRRSRTTNSGRCGGRRNPRRATAGQWYYNDWPLSTELPGLEASGGH